MSSVRRITKNAAFLAASEIISKLLQFFVTVYAARLLGKEGFGQFSYGLSFGMIAIVLFDSGIYTLLVREIARKPGLASKYIVNAAILKVIIAFFVILAAFSWILLSGMAPALRDIVLIMILFAFLSSFTEIFYSSFRAAERMQYDAMLKIFRMALLAGLAIYALQNGMGVIAFAACFAIAEAVVLCMAFVVHELKFAKLKPEMDWDFIKHIYREAWPFGLAFIFSSVYFYVNSIMLQQMRGDSEVGIYSAAYSMAFAILFIPTVYTSSIYPVMSKMFHSKSKMLFFLYEKSFKYLVLAGIPVAFGTFFLAGDIIGFFYGEAYKESALVLMIVAPFILLKFMNFLFGTALSSIDQQKSRTKAMAYTAAFSIAINIVLIPLYGFAGAAAAVLATEVFLLAIYYHGVSKFIGWLKFDASYAKALLAGIAMSAFLYYASLPLFAEIFIGAAIYAVILAISGAFDKEDLGLLKKMAEVSGEKGKEYAWG